VTLNRVIYIYIPKKYSGRSFSSQFCTSAYPVAGFRSSRIYDCLIFIFPACL